MSKKEIIYQLFIECKISLTEYLELVSKPRNLDVLLDFIYDKKKDQGSITRRA